MTAGPPGRRIAVFDAHWATAGGGETYAAGIAEVLSRRHDVTLISPDPIDTRWLGERLSMDLSRVSVAVVDPTVALEETSTGYDLLVNVSYRDHGRNGAARGVYVVHFPDLPGAEWSWYQKALNAVGRPFRARRTLVRFPSGFHPPDAVRWQQVRWTDGQGVLAVDLGPGERRDLHLWFGRFVPGGATRHLSVTVDDGPVVEAALHPPTSKLDILEPLRVDVPVVGRPGGTIVRITSESAVAHDVIGNGDHRRLGVPLVDVSTGGWPGFRLAARLSLLTADPPGTSWLDSYDLVVANSDYTQRWIARWWGRSSVVLEPPVRLRQPSVKDPIILSVGRFFAPGRGHAKKQLELVESFRHLTSAGLTAGWQLHLVGGCGPLDAPYLDQVRTAAAGLDVVFHVDATGAELDDLYARAALYWHATGLEEDIDADPVRAEHFGITTVEAMSAGAVPIVMAAGGQPDIVRDGVDGLLFTTRQGLLDATGRLLSDPEMRERLSASAIDRAARFGVESFAVRLESLLGRVDRGWHGTSEGEN
jgi:glycosyltransferase involved in cell wall biosynthesis